MIEMHDLSWFYDIHSFANMKAREKGCTPSSLFNAVEAFATTRLIRMPELSHLAAKFANDAKCSFIALQNNP